ncbi:MAG: AbrB/MazE/SpoVT family DNA-binding domain-containing protein [Desulfobacterales bacterium]
MEAITSRVTSKGQVVIPKQLRKKYAIAPATSIRWIEQEDGILMVPETDDPIQTARGMLRGSGLLKALRKTKQEEKERETVGNAKGK